MRCLKCGKDIPNGTVFCDSCLEDAKAYPVKPGTPIKLSFRDDPPATRPAAPRQTQSPVEHNQRLRRSVRNLRILVVLLSVLLLFMAGMLLHILTVG